MKTNNKPIQAGANAPAFSWKDSSGSLRKSTDLVGTTWILYFYPKDDTPGCTKEACGIRDQWKAFEERNIPVFGCSPDSEESHQKFKNKFDLPFELVSDTDKTIAKAYGVWGPKQFMGKSYEGVHRVTFIIDPQGKVAKVFPKVKPAEHAAELINTVDNLETN